MQEVIENLKMEKQRAAEMIELIGRIGQYPELPLFITRPGITRVLEIPYNERKNLLHFCLAVWTSELNRVSFCLDKFQLMERAGNEG